MKAFAISAKLKINVHDLNNELSAGNVSDIRQIDMIDLHGNVITVPAVSGRMLKHWHYTHYRTQIPEDKLCEACKVGEPLRPAFVRTEKGELSQVKPKGMDDIKKIIKECAVCDLHGYLIATKEKGAEEGTSTRRTSRAMFSWLLPVLDAPSASRQVIHTRVTAAATEDTSQMIFNKSYASADYAFVSYLDASKVGVMEDINEMLLENNEVKERVKAAILAYLHMLSGKTGASLSHALPHVDVLSVLVAYSKEGQFPVPVSPIYPDYISKTMGMMPSGVKLLGYGEAGEAEGVEKFGKLNELFNKVLGEL
ncbi:MAG: DevR family CRISPR-associated autoregulator [candidate division WOR-3 bacterium]